MSKAAAWKAKQNIEITSGTTTKVGTDASGKVKGSAKITIDAPKVDINNGGAPSPTAPTASPQDVKDPYGS
ncbi:MAG: hypothetical protein R2939_18270 [Kofleriaceae bacterium]